MVGMTPLEDAVKSRPQTERGPSSPTSPYSCKFVVKVATNSYKHRLWYALEESNLAIPKITAGYKPGTLTDMWRAHVPKQVPIRITTDVSSVLARTILLGAASSHLVFGCGGKGGIRTLGALRLGGLANHCTRPTMRPFHVEWACILANRCLWVVNPYAIFAFNFVASDTTLGYIGKTHKTLSNRLDFSRLVQTLLAHRSHGSLCGGRCGSRTHGVIINP